MLDTYLSNYWKFFLMAIESEKSRPSFQHIKYKLRVFWVINGTCYAFSRGWREYPTPLGLFYGALSQRWSSYYLLWKVHILTPLYWGLGLNIWILEGHNCLTHGNWAYTSHIRPIQLSSSLVLQRLGISEPAP